MIEKHAAKQQEKTLGQLVKSYMACVLKSMDQNNLTPVLHAVTTESGAPDVVNAIRPDGFYRVVVDYDQFRKAN